MSTCAWEKINDFQSLSEFNRFVDSMTAQTKSGAAQEVAVQAPYIGATTFQKKWFRCLHSGETWRLVWPDVPFKGVFERIDGEQPQPLLHPRSFSAAEFAVVDEVFHAHASEFASRGFILVKAAEGTPLVPSLGFEFWNAHAGLSLTVSFVVGVSGQWRSFNALIHKPDHGTLNVRDYLKLHGRAAMISLFTSDVPATELPAFTESAIRTLLTVFDNELRPVVEGRTFEETPIDWDGYK